MATTGTAWIEESDCDLDDFRAQVSRDTDLADYPLRRRRPRECARLLGADVAPADRRTLQAELIRALADGPGRGGLQRRLRPRRRRPRQRGVLRLIEAQRAAGVAAGDHFGKPGANDRIWNAAQKFALHAPAVFADYYANDALAMVCQAWLGPRYQVTSQVNVVNPGGEPRFRTATTTSASLRTTIWPPTPRMCTARRRC